MNKPFKIEAAFKAEFAAKPKKASAPAPTLPLATRAAQWLLLVFAATLPLYFDLNVPEVSGDIRWMMTSFFAGLVALVLLAGQLYRGAKLNPKFNLILRGPLQLWVAGGLALWALVSLADAMNWLRGIILLKALYAQLILLVCVWAVAKPTVGNEGFSRRLIWALCLPVAVTAFIGILQFHNFNQASFDDAIAGTPWLIFKPVLGLAGWLLQSLHSFTPQWPNTPHLIDQLTGYFLQSAVPGGSFANKNLAGSYTAMMIPLMVYLFFSAKRHWERGFAAGLLTLGLLFLLYSRARASWLAFLAAAAVGLVLVLLVPSLRAHVKNWLGWKTLVWLALPIFILAKHGNEISPIQGAQGIGLSPTGQMANLTSANGGWNEFGGRLAYNLNSLPMIRDHWLNGVGLGGFMVIWPPYYNAIVTTPTNSYNVMARPQRTHTDVMQAFDEMGVPGGVLYVLLFALGIGAGLRLLGANAGALGGKLVGAGLLGALLGLSAFLDYRNILALPQGWQMAFMGGLAAWLGYVLWRTWQRTRSVLNDPVKPLAEWQVAGFFTSLGLLCICLNSFLDFPMQLPTAPAAAALMMGLLLALHGALYPTAWQVGPSRTLSLPRKPFILACMALLAGAWGWALYDAAKFKEANTLLKLGMMRLYAGVADDTTLQIMEEANRVYALDPRIHEHLGVVYANYNGSLNIPTTTRIEKLEWVLSGDPWGANHLVNLAGQYIQRIEELRRDGDEAGATVMLSKLDTLVLKLMKVADFSHLSWGIAGITKLLAGKPTEAIPLLQRALVIDPTYAPAQSALQVAVSLTGVTPIVVNDTSTQRQ